MRRRAFRCRAPRLLPRAELSRRVQKKKQNCESRLTAGKRLWEHGVYEQTEWFTIVPLHSAILRRALSAV